MIGTRCRRRRLLACAAILLLPLAQGCRWLRGEATEDEQRPLERMPRSETVRPDDPMDPWQR